MTDRAVDRLGKKEDFDSIDNSRGMHEGWFYIDAIFGQMPSWVLYDKHTLIARVNIKEIKDIDVAQSLSGFKNSKN